MQGAVTVLFVVMFLADRSRTRQGAKAEACRAAANLLLFVFTECIPSKCDEYTALDMLFNAHFSKYKDSYLSPRGLMTNDVARKMCADLELYYPGDLPGEFNSKAYEVNSRDMLVMMLLLGKAPFPLLMAMAALIDDSLCRGSHVSQFEASQRPADAKRYRVCREEKGVAYFKFLNNLTKGIKANMMRPTAAGEDKNIFAGAEEDGGADDGSHTPCADLVLRTQTSSELGTQERGKEFQNVLKLGAKILYVNYPLILFVPLLFLTLLYDFFMMCRKVEYSRCFAQTQDDRKNSRGFNPPSLHLRLANHYFLVPPPGSEH